MADRLYGGLIWTNHALDRLRERGLSQEKALITYRNPDRTEKGKTPDSLELVKYFHGSRVGIIVKKNEKNQWMVLSAWTDPPLPGSADEKRQQEWRTLKKGPWWKKVLITFKRQMGF